MGIDVRIESEGGEVEAELIDLGHLTAKLTAPFTGCDSSCLRFIDAYGDTTFNQLQLPVLAGEIERAIEMATDPGVKSHGQSLLELAQRASMKVHTYLKFYGD